MYQKQLPWRPIIAMLVIALVWGSNMAFVKLASRDIAPLFMAGIRSMVAAMCLYIWMKAKGLALFPSRIIIFHGVVAGLLFGTEFGLIFVGLKHTLASRGYVILYAAPFFAALGAHFFLVDDRFNLWKVCGLILAFGGLVVLFLKNLGTFSFEALPGDPLEHALQTGRVDRLEDGGTGQRVRDDSHLDAPLPELGEPLDA